MCRGLLPAPPRCGWKGASRELRQNSSSPGSSAFRSMLATPQTAEASRPDRARNCSSAASNAAREVPRRQPTPSTRMFGTSSRASPAAFSTVTSASAGGPAVSSTPGGVSPWMGQGHPSRTVPPASSRAETAWMARGFSTRRPWRRAHWSMGKSPFLSVAVVITGFAPQARPMARARSLAPPRCPESRATAKFAHSSTATTAGSSHFFPT